jgi:hypothetical protein
VRRVLTARCHPRSLAACPPGESLYGSKCYWVAPAASARDGFNTCRAAGGRGAVFDSFLQLAAASALTGGARAFVGLVSNDASNGTWAWVDGRPLTWRGWWGPASDDPAATYGATAGGGGVGLVAVRSNDAAVIMCERAAPAGVWSSVQALSCAAPGCTGSVSFNSIGAGRTVFFATLSTSVQQTDYGSGAGKVQATTADGVSVGGECFSTNGLSCRADVSLPCVSAVDVTSLAADGALTVSMSISADVNQCAASGQFLSALVTLTLYTAQAPGPPPPPTVAAFSEFSSMVVMHAPVTRNNPLNSLTALWAGWPGAQNETWSVDDVVSLARNLDGVAVVSQTQVGASIGAWSVSCPPDTCIIAGFMFQSSLNAAYGDVWPSCIAQNNGGCNPGGTQSQCAQVACDAPGTDIAMIVIYCQHARGGNAMFNFIASDAGGGGGMRIASCADEVCATDNVCGVCGAMYS